MHISKYDQYIIKIYIHLIVLDILEAKWDEKYINTIKKLLISYFLIYVDSFHILE